MRSLMKRNLSIEYSVSRTTSCGGPKQTRIFHSWNMNERLNILRTIQNKQLAKLHSFWTFLADQKTSADRSLGNTLQYTKF